MSHAARTHPGLRRSNNEDVVLVRPLHGLYAVFDGVGGNAAGERAAAVARDVAARGPKLHELALRVGARPTPEERRRVEDALRAACGEASAAVFEMGEREGLRGTATTVVAALVGDGLAWIAHVGDSRAYLLRGGRLHRITEDHTLVNEMVSRGVMSPEQAAASRRRNVITRALGAAPDVLADVVEVEILPGDRLLLCSDGLSDCASAEAIRAGLVVPDPEAAADALVNAALEGGGRDNVSVVVVDLQPGQAADRVAARAQVLAGLAIFRDLSLTQRLQLGRVIADRHVPQGEIVVEQGEAGTTMYAVVAGRVAVSRDGIVLAQLGPGQPFGELALVDNDVRSARVTALEPTHLLCIERDVFARFCQEHPHLGLRILWRLAALVAERLRDTSRRLAATRDDLEVLPFRISQH